MATLESLVVILAGLIFSVRGEFSWTSCAPADSPVSVTNINVSPDPIVIPGGVSLTVDAQSTTNITYGSLRIAMTREFLFTSITIPCIMSIGSCTYGNVCNITDSMVKDNWAGIMSGVGTQIQGMMSGSGLSPGSSCTQGPTTVHVGPTTIQIPALPSALKLIANGKYHIHIELKEATHGNIVLCLDTHVAIQGCSGLSCIFGKK